MKKIVRRILVLLLIFIGGVAGFSCLLNNKNTDNRTDFQTPTVPCMAMLLGETEVNRMYGYAETMQTDYMRDTLTPMGTDKTLAVSITPYGSEVDSLVYEVRTSDGSKVIENNKIKRFHEQADGTLTAEFTLQKSILMNQEYSLVFTLNTEKGSWNYYTRVIQRAGLNTQKYIDFVNNFYQKAVTQNEKGDLSTYLETDDSPGNNSFNNLNIHASLNMVSWGNLAPEISRPGIPSIKDINENTGSVSITYYITAENGEGDIERYQVEEFFRMRYDQTRVRLLDFNRSAKQILTAEQTIVAGGRLNLGVTGNDVQYKADTEGNIVAFVQQGDLWSYHVKNNKLVRIFSFRDTGSNDERNDYTQHDIEIVRVSKNGDVDFILYGYMNRGGHEGQVGTAVYHYSAEKNVIEEKFFLTSTKSFEFLKQEIGEFAYASKNGNLYLLFENALYCFNMEDKSYTVIQEGMDREYFYVSENGRYAAWMEGMDPYHADNLILMDLETGEQEKISGENGSKIRIFGFINNDMVYGLANEGDILGSGSQTQFGMYEVRIQNRKGEVKKSYHQDGYYVTNIVFQDNLIQLERARKEGDTYVAVGNEQILNNVRDKEDETFSVVMLTTERQANITGIQFASTDVKEPLTVVAKFMENTRDNVLTMEKQETEEEAYYVYALGKLWGIYKNAADAVKAADENMGVVLNQNQQYLWERGNSKDQGNIELGDIPEAVKSASPDAAALKEAVRNTGTVADLTGCTLDQILYEISYQRPVVTKIEGGQVRVIVGFDLYNMYLYDPQTKETKPMGLQDSKKAFEENGNVFICYIDLPAE